MNNKKIFFVADSKSIHTVKWVDYFINKGYCVHLATFATVNNTNCRNIYFLSNKSSNVYGGNYHYILAIKKLVNILISVKPTIINAHYSYSMGFIALIAKKIAKVNSRFSVVCHGSDILSPPKPFIFDLINKYVLKNSDKIFVVSDQIKDKIESFNIDLNKVFVGQYGIDITIKNYKKDIDILSNRNYTSNSRIEFLLDSLKSFENKGLNIVFILPHISKDKIEEFKKEYPFINFYSYIPYEDIIDIINRSKIYISATKSDGTSLSLLEAMYCGAIPIVSNITSNRSLILDNINGYLFNTKDELKNKLYSLLDLENKERDLMNKINCKIINEKALYKRQMVKINKFLLGE